ncbi:hypothetical protein evm_005312 [Chilo suppressalis]|nr:hypothetical protein evm_005312 [Chilo suppressalis]
MRYDYGAVKVRSLASGIASVNRPDLRQGCGPGVSTRGVPQQRKGAFVECIFVQHKVNTNGKLWGSGAFFLPPQGMYYPVSNGNVIDTGTPTLLVFTILNFWHSACECECPCIASYVNQ